MKPIFMDKFLLKLYDENNNKITEEGIEFLKYPTWDDVEIEMQFYRTNYPFKETSKFKVKKITIVRWVEDDE